VKAQNLTISVPGNKCDKNCDYCISTITWQPEDNVHLMFDNLSKVKRVADRSDVTNLLITSKKEPFLNCGELLAIAREFSDYWIEVQTNGRWLNSLSRIPIELVRSKINVVAFSIDELKQVSEYAETFHVLKKHGIITRVCFNITNMITGFYSFFDIMREATKYKDEKGLPLVRQVLFRNINYPSTADKNHPVVKWIDKHVKPKDYRTLITQAKRAIDAGDIRKLRVIPHTGTTIYSYMGASICFSDYCIQESNKTEDIRSLIFQSDGHLYTSWDDPASILF
jgi:hypothetical protein